MFRGQIHDRDQRERLIEIIQNREIWTGFQPIIDLSDGSIMGYEGLSRGPRGTERESPGALFGRARRYGVDVPPP